ncbi:MAG TPA: hypothetical protein VGP61_09235 [Gemmatimonadales bacterium]|jgi:hypothetical protein|nr:hypothetical protein [Gemmatimonadales bacterium]
MKDVSTAPVLSRLAQPLRWFAGFWIFLSLFEFLLNVWPLQFQSLAWRYAAEGLFSSSLPVLALACFILNALALLERKYRALRRVIRLHGGLALLYVLCAVDFALNARELRDTAVSGRDAELVFVVGAAKVALKYLGIAGVQLLAAIASWRWMRDNPEPDVIQLSSPKRPWWLFWWPEPVPRQRRRR